VSCQLHASGRACVRVGAPVGRAPSGVRPPRPAPAAPRESPPAVSKLGANGAAPASGTRPWVGRMPYRPQKLAGILTEPAQSVPSENSQRPPATADAEPLEEPPGIRSGQAGLSGVP